VSHPLWISHIPPNPTGGLARLGTRTITAIYGFEDSEGIQALVLELCEGPTLADAGGQHTDRRSASVMD